MSIINDPRNTYLGTVSAKLGGEQTNVEVYERLDGSIWFVTPDGREIEMKDPGRAQAMKAKAVANQPAQPQAPVRAEYREPFQKSPRLEEEPQQPAPVEEPVSTKSGKKGKQAKPAKATKAPAPQGSSKNTSSSKSGVAVGLSLVTLLSLVAFIGYSLWKGQETDRKLDDILNSPPQVIYAAEGNGYSGVSASEIEEKNAILIVARTVNANGEEEEVVLGYFAKNDESVENTGEGAEDASEVVVG